MRDALTGGELGLSDADIFSQFGALDKRLVGVDGQQNGSTAAVLCQHQRALRGLHLLDEASDASDASAKLGKGTDILAGSTTAHGPASERFRSSVSRRCSRRLR